MENMTLRERVEYMTNLKIEDSTNLDRMVVGGVVHEDYETGRVCVRRDLRSELRAKLLRENVSQASFARALGIHKAAVNNYLGGLRALPYDIIEEILWYLDGDMKITE